MKAPPGMSKTVTHRLTIVDRSGAGMVMVNEISTLASFADERINPWRASTERFMIFIVEEAKGGRLGAMAAKDIDDLLSKIDELFVTHLLPPANPSFDFLIDGPDRKKIHDYAAKQLLATVAALEAGARP
jgi:hypothetical protein